jgi:hypothetical protein
MSTTPFVGIILLIMLSACENKKGTVIIPESFILQEKLNVYMPLKQVRGQTLYLPVYSSIPYDEGHRVFNLSAFLAVHNTDLDNEIRITGCYYFNHNGLLVKDYLRERTVIVKPLATVHYFVPESDTSGVGANFILDWNSDSLVNEPLVESVMVSLKSGQGISFASNGKIISEIP